MSKFTRIGFFATVIVAALAAGSYSVLARPGGGHGGGGGGGGRGGGGGVHAGGGGGAHFGGGARGGGGARFSGARVGGGARFSGGGGRRFNGGGPAVSRAARSGGRFSRGYAGRGNSNRVVNRSGNRNGNRVTNQNAQQNNAGRAAAAINRNAVSRNARSNAVRNTLASRSVAGALRNRSAFRNPNARRQIAANAAMAGFRNGRGNGWWRHRHGGYGWVGPLFWPFAYNDLYDYAYYGYGYDPAFWDYGYDDIYAGMFSPYGYDDLSGYLPQGGGTRVVRAPSSSSTPADNSNASDDQLAQMCGDDSKDIAGLPIDQMQQAIQPNAEQRAALDDLGNASISAAQKIRSACPSDAALTAPKRLAAMQARVEAMLAGVQIMQPPMEKFYGLLNDEQKAKLNGLGQQQRQSQDSRQDSPTKPQDCNAAQNGLQWPTSQIEKTVHPTDTQRASLTVLQDATAKAGTLLASSCQPSNDLTPPARLAAAGKRLNDLLQAVTTVRVALDDFYGSLSDEQKAQFEAIGPQKDQTVGQASDAGQSNDQPRQRRRHYGYGYRNVEGIIRHFIAIAR